ncbi:MAG: iron ABC transporter permease [bacterium]
MKRNIIVFTIVILMLLLLMLTSITIGESNSKASFIEVLVGIFTKDNQIVNMFVAIRAPRTIVAVCVGAALGISGVLLQVVTKSNLAEPSIIGVSSSTFLVHLICGMILPAGLLIISPILAFIVGVLVFALILFLSWDNGLKSNRILLVGIAFNTFILLIILTLIMMTGLNASAKLMTLIGSLSIPSIEEVYSTVILTVIGVVFAILLAPKCNVLALGDKVATGLGVKVNLYKCLLIGLSIFFVSIATKMVGITAFIGLLAPILAKKLLNKNYFNQIIMSGLLGGIFVLFGDFVGRCIINDPFSMPVGMITSLFGGVIFIILLKRSFKNGI